jgi:PAS domain S-box-containing protein
MTRARRAEELLRRAEAVAQDQKPATPEVLEHLDPDAIHKAYHALRVHQIELEMQNDELQRAQADLACTRARYFDLYDLAPVGYLTVAMGGEILESNLTAVTLLGMNRTELLNKPLTAFILAEDQDVYYLHHKRFLETQEASACELRLVRKDGTQFWARLTATGALDPARNPGDAPEGAPVIRVLMSDITERKLAEAERARLQEQLQEAQKLETLGVLAGGVAHDFNNLLTTILGNANLGTLALERGADTGLFFTAIEKAAVRAADLTRQLLAYAGKGKFVVSEVDLGILAKEITQLLAVSIPKTTVLECDLAERLPFVKGDAVQLFQVLMNLVTNASEAVSKDVPGVITIRTRMEVLREAELASGCRPLPLEPGRYVTLEVTDSGAGMTPEIMARAFEPFFTTKFTGRGLGLAAVIGILRNHGGGLCLRSEPGHGSSFKVFLPPMLEARPAVVEEQEPLWQGEGRILLVDDEPEVRTMARRMAERVGLTVLEARDGLEAMVRFREHHEDLSLVLMDLSMPRLNGREAFGEMHKFDPHVPVVLSSGYDVAEADLMVEGMAGFLKKPYRVAEFQSLLRRLLREPAQA